MSVMLRRYSKGPSQTDLPEQGVETVVNKNDNTTVSLHSSKIECVEVCYNNDNGDNNNNNSNNTENNNSSRKKSGCDDLLTYDQKTYAFDYNTVISDLINDKAGIDDSLLPLYKKLMEGTNNTKDLSDSDSDASKTTLKKHSITNPLILEEDMQEDELDEALVSVYEKIVNKSEPNNSIKKSNSVRDKPTSTLFRGGSTNNRAQSTSVTRTLSTLSSPPDLLLGKKPNNNNNDNNNTNNSYDDSNNINSKNNNDKVHNLKNSKSLTLEIVNSEQNNINIRNRSSTMQSTNNDSTIIETPEGAALYHNKTSNESIAKSGEFDLVHSKSSSTPSLNDNLQPGKTVQRSKSKRDGLFHKKKSITSLEGKEVNNKEIKEKKKKRLSTQFRNNNNHNNDIDLEKKKKRISVTGKTDKKRKTEILNEPIRLHLLTEHQHFVVNAPRHEQVDWLRQTFSDLVNIPIENVPLPTYVYGEMLSLFRPIGSQLCFNDIVIFEDEHKTN